MSLASQFRSLGRQSAAFRKEIFGTDTGDAPVTFSYDRGARENIEGYYQFVKRRYSTQEGGVIEQQGAILRIPKVGQSGSDLNPFVPELQKTITFKDATGRQLTFIIEDFLGTHTASVEWVLGCRLA
jgi:hypothetical protein